MTTDLWMLVASAILCLLIPGIYLAGRSQAPGGTQWGFGNRDTTLPVPAWTARAVRAHANLVENLTPFAIVVLTAHVTGNFVLIGSELVHASGEAWPKLLAFPAFILAVAVAVKVAEALERKHKARVPTLL